jgi:single-stranded-DNA-specific exonuclease
MVKKHWVFKQIDATQQAALAAALSISPITASVLLSRGLTTEDQARRWLSSDLCTAHDPFLLPDMERAVDRLHTAVTRSERICFYGDYDVDGISATSQYVTFFRSLGAEVTAYIPHRVREGYGLNAAAIRQLAAQGITLLVTSDCGTTSYQEVAEANRLGLDVIITDHHQADGTLPAAFAVLNPHRADSRYPFAGLCSGGLAWKVTRAYRSKYGGADPDAALDLVALATIADVVPLHDENRYFVREGLKLITRGSRCGLRALKLVAGLQGPCTTGAVAFRLAPRINASGRMAHGDLGVRLLTTESEAEAKRLAEEHERLNRERQQLEQATVADALGKVDREDAAAALVLGTRHWSLGVVGIVAARLVERFHRPSVVLAINEHGLAKGSARSVPGFDVFMALSECRDLLEAFGGHPSAAGLTIREERLDEFSRRFAAVAEAWTADMPSAPTLHVDAEVSLCEVDLRLVRELERLHPFGSGNPEPTLAVRNLNILETRVVGDRHLKLTVRHGASAPFDTIGFRMGSLADLGLSASRPVDLAFVPEANRWNGLDRIQLRIRDLRASQALS